MYAGNFNDPEKVMRKNCHGYEQDSDIYGACRHKMAFHQFCLSTDDTVFNGWKGKDVKGLFKSYDLKLSTVALNTEQFS